MFNMLIHDKKLGSAPALPNIHNTYPVYCKRESGESIVHIWGWTAECAKRNGGINNLLIACHGGYVGGAAYDELGGWGISLGEGINLNNVQSINVLKGFVNNIYLYVCGGAMEPDSNQLTAAEKKSGYFNQFNNRLMAKQMAQYTGCNVYAAARQQAYFVPSDKSNFFDFSTWEGKVVLFKYIKNIGVITKNVTAGMNSFGEEE